MRVTGTGGVAVSAVRVVGAEVGALITARLQEISAHARAIDARPAARARVAARPAVRAVGVEIDAFTGRGLRTGLTTIARADVTVRTLRNVIAEEERRARTARSRERQGAKQKPERRRHELRLK